MKRRFVAGHRKHIQLEAKRASGNGILHAPHPHRDAGPSAQGQSINDWSGFRFRHFIVRGKTEHIDCKRP
jgi:hypothetical protein